MRGGLGGECVQGARPSLMREWAGGGGDGGGGEGEEC
jgi:hypothetical protein